MNSTRNRSVVVAAIVAIVTSAGALAHASDQIPQTKQLKPVALVGGVIHSADGVVDGGTILLVDGKIAAIGKNVTLPEGTERVDINGKHVYPGLIAANTAMGLVEVSSVRATRDYGEVGSINPNVRAEVSVNPDSELIPVGRANGILASLVVPMTGLVSGTSALMAMDGWTWEDMTLKAPLGLHVSWPRMTVNTAWWNDTPKKKQLERRDERIRSINDIFADARAYAKARAASEKKGIPYHDSDMRLEAMLPVLAGDVPVYVNASGIDEINAAIDWAVANGLKMVLVGGYDAGLATDLLKKHDIPVIITGVHRTPGRRWADYDEPFKLPLVLHEAGVRYCIATRNGGFSTAHIRNLPYHAAMAAAFGLPKEEALKAITQYPADILGVGERLGSLAVGKDATLIVTDGDPLEIVTHVERAFISGRVVDLTSRHTQLYDKYSEKQRQLRAGSGR